MSAIISSYIIGPVIRQARRFSFVKPAQSLPDDPRLGSGVIDDTVEKPQKHKSKSTCPVQDTNKPQDQETDTKNYQVNNSPDIGQNNLVSPALEKDSLCICASRSQSHVITSPHALLSTAQPASGNPLTTTSISIPTSTTSHVDSRLPCPLHSLSATASRRQSTQTPRSTISDRPIQLLPDRFTINPVISSQSGIDQQRVLARTRSLGSLFSESVFSDRDWSACSQQILDNSCLTDFRAGLQSSTMNTSDELRSHRLGSEASALTRNDSNQTRRSLGTRRYSWADNRRTQTMNRRPTLHDHYTDSLLVLPADETSRTKHDEDIISRESGLRRKIQEICQLTISNEEKAKRIHYVMNEQYLCRMEEQQRKKSLDNLPSQRPRSADSCESGASSAASGVDMELYLRFNVSPGDLVPTRRPRRHSEDTSNMAGPNFGMTPMPSGTPQSEDEPAEPEYELGCEHYKRNVKIQCFECKQWWNCRYCHDAADPGHALPRHLTENMLCMLCQTPGPAGQYCEHCGEQSAYYFCEVCKLWDDDSTKRIYHCADCGICRLGEGLGKDFQHCKKCNVCIPFQQFSWHKCLERATDCDCPICGDYMFSSKAPIVSMPCGHYLHRTCYNQYMLNSYQCPICKKSARNMESQWRKMEEETARQPMPLNLRNVSVDVRCNDCSGKSRVPYHWLGNKCALCDSFNTTEIEIHRDGGGLAPTTSPSPPRGNWRSVRSIPQRRVRRYFEDEEEQQDVARSPTSLGDTVNAESLLGLPNTAYELFATMTRNLSPIRRYLNTRDDTRPTGMAQETAATEGEIERMGFWTLGGDAAGSHDEAWEDDEDDDSDEEYESTDDEGLYMIDDDSDSSSEGGLGLDALDVELIGHR